jgi:hypothetical protein
MKFLLDKFMENLGVFVGVALAIVLFLFYADNMQKKNEITRLTSTVSELSNKNSVLEQRVDGYISIIKASNQASKEQQDGVGKQQEIETETLEALKKAIENKGANDAKASDSDLLPDDTVRLLNGHCNKVRGSACPNP